MNDNLLSAATGSEEVERRGLATFFILAILGKMVQQQVADCIVNL